VDLIEVNHVESPEHDAVQQHRPESLERAETTDERDHPPGPVGPVDPDPSYPNRLDMLGQGERDRGDRGVPVPTVERPVVDSDDPRMHLPERPPQG